MKRVFPKKLIEICSEWDIVCEHRQNTIDAGDDISLLSVTAPCIVKHILQAAPKKVLDVGCGTGYLTSLVSQNVNECWGIDASGKSIAIAKKRYASQNTVFVQTTIEDFCSPFPFDACISNMVLTSDPLFRQSLKKMHDVLSLNGHLYIMIPHPCFWPKYWNYQDEPWFNYNEEIFIEHDFSISLVKSMGTTTYIHRSLATYIESILSVGFCIEQIEEPYPVGGVPKGYAYQYPRFLFIKCKK